MPKTTNGIPIKKRTKNADARNIKRMSRILMFFFLAILLVILIVAICIFVYILASKYGDSKINLESYKNSQNQTSILYAYDDNGDPYEIATLHGTENRIWVDIDDMPQDLLDAFVALEDKRFYSHNGVDWTRTIGAVLKYHFTQGGSTITQQLIKNLTGENSGTFSRKFNEILYALNLEQNYSKKEILEAYLNTIPLGSGCYGVQTASQTYFGKDVSELNAAECATLASITKAPTKYNPLLNPDNNAARRKVCLKNMYDQKMLTEDEYNQAINYDIIFTNSDKYVASDTDKNKTETETETKINSWYVDYVIDSVIDDLVSKYGYSKTEAFRMVYYGGLKIYTAEDEDIQNTVQNIYETRTAMVTEDSRTESGNEDGSNKKVQSAMVIMDYKGRVVGIAGGAGPKTINRGYNRATDAVRQPGSSIKPLSCYAPAVEENLINYSSLVENYAVIVEGKLWPKNDNGDNGSSGSYVTVQYALSQSLNTTAVRVLKLVGSEDSLNYLTDEFHLSALVTSGDNTDANYSSLGVGGMSYGVKPIEMCAAYAAFGNSGYYYKPYCYYKVTDASGSTTYLENDEKGTKILSADTADVMNKLLQTVVTSGTGRGYGVSRFNTFMKTGTTSDNKDKWAIGGTPYYVAAVWYGYDSKDVIKNASGNPAARIWSAVMNKIHDGLEVKDFTYKGVIKEATYCTKTGLLASDSCTSTAVGWYKANSMPKTCTSCSGKTETTTSE